MLIDKSARCRHGKQAEMQWLQVQQDNVAKTATLLPTLHHPGAAPVVSQPPPGAAPTMTSTPSAAVKREAALTADLVLLNAAAAAARPSADTWRPSPSPALACLICTQEMCAVCGACHRRLCPVADSPCPDLMARIQITPCPSLTRSYLAFPRWRMFVLSHVGFGFCCCVAHSLPGHLGRVIE